MVRAACTIPEVVQLIGTVFSAGFELLMHGPCPVGLWMWPAQSAFFGERSISV